MKELFSSDELDKLEELLGYKFSDRTLLMKALTHNSFANEHNIEKYQRLEFLGDSIIGFLVTCQLFDKIPDEEEGFLTKKKASIVSDDSHITMANALGIDKFIKFTGGEIPQRVKADVIESIVGAIYVDSKSMDAVKDFIFEFYLSDTVILSDNITDYKSEFKEYAEKSGLSFSFSIKELGNLFQATAVLDGKLIASGKAAKKSVAEQIASEKAMKKLLCK